MKLSKAFLVSSCFLFSISSSAHPLDKSVDVLFNKYEKLKKQWDRDSADFSKNLTELTDSLGKMTTQEFRKTMKADYDSGSLSSDTVSKVSQLCVYVADLHSGALDPREKSDGTVLKSSKIVLPSSPQIGNQFYSKYLYLEDRVLEKTGRGKTRDYYLVYYYRGLNLYAIAQRLYDAIGTTVFHGDEARHDYFEEAVGVTDRSLSDFEVVLTHLKKSGLTAADIKKEIRRVKKLRNLLVDLLRAEKLFLREITKESAWAESDLSDADDADDESMGRSESGMYAASSAAESGEIEMNDDESTLRSFAEAMMTLRAAADEVEMRAMTDSKAVDEESAGSEVSGGAMAPSGGMSVSGFGAVSLADSGVMAPSAAMGFPGSGATAPSAAKSFPSSGVVAPSSASSGGLPGEMVPKQMASSYFVRTWTGLWGTLYLVGVDGKLYPAYQVGSQLYYLGIDGLYYPAF